jgi:hypothetical protein
MSQFEWMRGKRIDSVKVDEAQNWYFAFEDSGSINIFCPWRIVSQNRIVVSNDDHQQQFGLPWAA